MGIVVIKSLNCVWLFVTPWTAALQASLSITNSRSLLELMFIKSVMPSNHLILCHPLLLLPSIFPSIRIFSSKSALHIRWPKEWSFSFSISPSNEYYSGLISFRIDWFDLLAVQGTLKSLLQYHSLKSINSLTLSFLCNSTLTSIYNYWKTIALTRQTFAFSKFRLNIWKIMVHVLLKPGLENFEHYFGSVWDECNCVVIWTFLWHCLSLGLEWKLTFSSPVATAEFSKFPGILKAAL